ncbi:non-LTR retroelement reverse transcriptase [Tanacetum coccineum]
MTTTPILIEAKDKTVEDLSHEDEDSMYWGCSSIGKFSMKSALKHWEILCEVSIIRWVPPPLDWVLLNTDGASRSNPGEAGGGGILRDSRGCFLRAFTENYGICTITRSEILALIHGIIMARDVGIRKLIIKVESQVVLEHCYREANRAADWLANHGCEQEERLCMFDSPPPDLGSIILEDLKGVALSRRNVGQLKVHSRSRAWKKQGGGKVVEVDASKISRITWMKVPRSNQLGV